MTISSLLLKEFAEPETYEEITSKYPDCSVIEEIVKRAKSFEFKRFEILKCPLIVEVESSIVRKKF